MPRDRGGDLLSAITKEPQGIWLFCKDNYVNGELWFECIPEGYTISTGITYHTGILAVISWCRQ